MNLKSFTGSVVQTIEPGDLLGWHSLSSMAGVAVNDSTLLRVPFEALKRAAKDRKALVDEVGEVLSDIHEKPESGEASPDLETLVLKLHGIKRKLKYLSQVEKEGALHCKARLEHMVAIGTPSKDQLVPWTKRKLDRLLVDHLLRTGSSQTAHALAKQSGIQDLVELQIFEEAQVVLRALKNRDCSAGLDWCARYRVRLKKLKSKLEFRLHAQHFVELVREGKPLKAILYARQNMAPWAAQNLPEFEKAISTVLCSGAAGCMSQHPLFSPSAWTDLISLFQADFYKLHGLTSESLLVIHLQAGLSALKTPHSYQPGSNKEDPLHLPQFQRLAADLPFAKHVHSKLVCSVTQEIMNHANPPMVLPNGYVYSQKAIQQIMAKNNSQVVCPRTGSVYSFDELRRAFIA